MRMLLTILVLMCPLSLFAQQDSVDVWISKINNASIAGTCRYGWIVAPKIEEVSKLINAEKFAEKKLFSLLTDERKGVVAHYILSNIHDELDYSIDASETNFNYNGLPFKERARGMVAEKADLERIKREWAKKLSD